MLKKWVSRFFSRKPKRLTSPLLEQIRRSFDEAARDEVHFPSTIDPRIQHVRLILECFGDLSGKRVLDAGCGKGRFARILQQGSASAEIWGLDISPEMLKFVPAGIRTVAGSMTALPFPPEIFDCVYATESLEHAVEIDKAVSELCRVLKPEGSLVIIDKNIEHFGKLETPAWEKWFDRKELEGLLRRDCREVSSRFLSYWADVQPDGMFLAWIARK
jgi:ubiquinone/menaquinone biosynthesis C-methylase UbiE